MSRSPRVLLAVPALLVSGLCGSPAFAGDASAALRDVPMCANPVTDSNTKAPPPRFVACATLEVPPVALAEVVAPVPRLTDHERNVLAAAAARL